MQYLPNVIFVILLVVGVGFFVKNISKLKRNIFLGKEASLNDNKPQRWKNMAKIALGQTKMVVRPIAGMLHINVYVGFIIGIKAFTAAVLGGIGSLPGVMVCLLM